MARCDLARCDLARCDLARPGPVRCDVACGAMHLDRAGGVTPIPIPDLTRLAAFSVGIVLVAGVSPPASHRSPQHAVGPGAVPSARKWRGPT